MNARMLPWSGSGRPEGPGRNVAFFPIQRGLIETFEPRFRRPEHDPAEWQGYRERMDAQLRWNEAAHVPDSIENKQLWHRKYLRGPAEPVEPPHRIRTRLKPFED